MIMFAPVVAPAEAGESSSRGRSTGQQYPCDGHESVLVGLVSIHEDLALEHPPQGAAEAFTSGFGRREAPMGYRIVNFGQSMPTAANPRWSQRQRRKAPETRPPTCPPRRRPAVVAPYQ